MLPWASCPETDWCQELGPPAAADIRDCCAGGLPQLGQGWGSGQGLLVLPAGMPSTRREARELLSLVERMLAQPLLAASL